MVPAALSTGIVGVPTLTVELGVRADVQALQVDPVDPVDLVELPLGRIRPMANVDVVMVTFFVIPIAPFIRELVVPRTDGVATPQLTVEMDARADVMAQLVVLGVTLEVALEHHLRHHLAPKNQYWARLRVRLQTAAILLTVPAVQATGILFVVTGQTVVVVLYTG